LAKTERVIVLGMGTSLHAAAVGSRMIETLARIPAQSENASEFRYRKPVIGPSTLVIAVSQSGETVDTLAAMEEAKSRDGNVISLTNNPMSQGAVMADYTLDIRAGAEIGVASTKCLTNSILALYLLAATIGRERGLISGGQIAQIVDDLVRLPSLVSRALETDSAVRELALKYYRATNYLYLGRGINYPVAMEGALKLKEISYCHAEGYQAGEMKHGPIALIDEEIPVMALALKDSLYPKMINNIEEVNARNGSVIAIATEGDVDITSRVDHVIHVPPVTELLSPLVSVVPLQLFAYHVAVTRGCDVDQPRNLAKSVTVE
jgi:glucosamine--fructose-6-phosphate aminotransferase (isomerizing)